MPCAGWPGGFCTFEGSKYFLEDVTVSIAGGIIHIHIATAHCAARIGNGAEESRPTLEHLTIIMFRADIQNDTQCMVIPMIQATFPSLCHLFLCDD